MGSIKNRLKIAYENVAFYASDIWTNNMDTYQKANQELFIRESKLRDILGDEPGRPRTVRDTIPNSKLAQYSNYEYNESRELCYSSSSDNVAIYYPCVCKQDALTEPWMLPEVEKMFIYTAYPIEQEAINIIRIEKLHTREQEDKNHCNVHCKRKDIHVIYPILLQTFEKTPGKLSYKCCLPTTTHEISKYLPLLCKINTLEEMILKMKIKSDTVKSLWSGVKKAKKDDIKQKNKNTLKLSLEKYFLTNGIVNKFNTENVPNYLGENSIQLKRDDYKQLCSLGESFQTLEYEFLNKDEQYVSLAPTNNKKITNYNNNISNQELPPTRRLYSAVLQGLTSDEIQVKSSKIKSFPNISHISSSDVLATASSKTFNLGDEDNSLAVLKSSYKSTPILSKSQFPSPSTSSFSSSPSSDTSSSQSSTNSYNQYQPINSNVSISLINKSVEKLSSSNNCTIVEPKEITNPISTSFDNKTTPVTAHQPSCSTENNTNIPNCTNLNCATTSTVTNTSGFVSSHVNSNFFNNNYYPSQINSNHQNTTYTGNSVVNNPYLNNCYHTHSSVPTHSNRNVYSPYNGQPYSASQVYMSSPQSMWFLQNNRPASTVYSVAHFASPPCFYFPLSSPTQTPLRSNSRWTAPANYARTPTLPSYHVPVPLQNLSSTPSQSWGISSQNLCRTNSNHQISNTFSNLIENQPGISNKNRFRIKTCNNDQLNCVPLNVKTTQTQESSDKWYGDQLANQDIQCDRQNCFSNKSACSSDVLFPLSQSEKSNLKHIESTPSFDCRQTADAQYNSLFGVKKQSFLLLNNQTDGLDYYESDQADSGTFLPVIPSFSDELERQAIEQYEPSNENFYQELEREAKEQYNDDHSENWMSPPHKKYLFGGLKNIAFLLISFLLCETN